MPGRKRATVSTSGSDDEAAPSPAVKGRASGAAKRRRGGGARPVDGPILGSCASVVRAVDHSETRSHAKFLKKCARFSGCDIRKDTSAARSRRARHMLVFPGRLRDVAGGRAGHLRDLDTAEPKLFLDAGTDKVLALTGAHVKSSRRYAMLGMASRRRGPPQVTCDSMFDTLVVFHKAELMRVGAPGGEEGAPPTLRPCSPPVTSAPGRASGRRRDEHALAGSQDSAQGADHKSAAEDGGGGGESSSAEGGRRRRPRRAGSAVKSYREAAGAGGEEGGVGAGEEEMESEESGEESSVQ